MKNSKVNLTAIFFVIAIFAILAWFYFVTQARKVLHYTKWAKQNELKSLLSKLDALNHLKDYLDRKSDKLYYAIVFLITSLFIAFNILISHFTGFPFIKVLAASLLIVGYGLGFISLFLTSYDAKKYLLDKLRNMIRKTVYRMHNFDPSEIRKVDELISNLKIEIEEIDEKLQPTSDSFSFPVYKYRFTSDESATNANGK